MAVSEGEMESAVARSIWLEIPSGPEAVWDLSEASILWTSASLQVTQLSFGPDDVGRSEMLVLEGGLKQDAKNSLRRFALADDDRAEVLFCFRSVDILVFFGESLWKADQKSLGEFSWLASDLKNFVLAERRFVVTLLRALLYFGRCK